jgi:hypothetical protein
VPLLASHRGTPPDLILRWNAMQAVPERVDVVLHLHGFSGHGEAMRIDRHKLPDSGLDFANPANLAESGRTTPTLAVLPGATTMAAPRGPDTISRRCLPQGPSIN